MAENTSRELIESTNENNKPRRKVSISSATFLQQFVHDYVDTRPAAIKNELIEEAMAKDTLSGTKIAQWLAEFRASDDKYSDINISETWEWAIDIAMIRRYLAKGYVQIKKLREDFEKKVLKDYEVTSQEYSQKLITHVKGLSTGEISRLIQSGYKLSSFLKQKLGREVSSKVHFDLLAGVSEAQMQERMRKMKEPDKSEIGNILLKIQNGKIPTHDQMKHLIVSSLFDEKQKVQFIHQYLPFITLQQGLDIGLIKEWKAKQIIQEYVRDAIADKHISADNTDKLVELLKPQDIQIATKDIIHSVSDIEAIIEWVGFEDFIVELQEESKESIEALRASWPKSFEGLKASLGTLWERKCQNTLLFEPGNILQFTKKSAWENDIHYIKVLGFDDDKKEFTYQALWGWKLNRSSDAESQVIRYEDFFNNFSSDTASSFIAMTQSMLDEKIRKKEILTTELNLYSEIDLEWENHSETRKEIQAKEIRSLQEELAQAKEKLSRENTSNNQSVVTSLEKQIQEAQERDFSLSKLTYLANKFALLDALNEIDSQGASLGLWNNNGQKVAFQTGKDETANTYTIQNVDYAAWTITLHSRAWVEKDMRLDAFYEGFKKHKPKRVKALQSESELVSQFGENFAFDNGEIIQKDAELNGEKKNRPVEYLENGKHKLIKIVSLSGWYVEFQEGEIHDADDHGHGSGWHGHGHGKKEKKYSLKIKWAQLQKWTLDEFHRYVSEQELKADWKIWQNYEERPQDPKNPTHGSLIDRFFKWMSLYEIMHGWQMVFEGIKETLEHWSHAKSAHAALAMAKWLPESLRDEMFMKVEAAEAEETESAKKKLGAIDSWMAVARIEKWLLNRDTPQYKLEAGALFMMEKYGHLTSKKGLYPYRGKFLWYERLGWKIGDELYNEVMNGMSADDQSFAEERLIHQLLKKQCNSEAHHYSGIHRRSRVHKEFENAWKSWIAAELEKWEKDASAFRWSSRMAREWMDEAKGGTSSNAFGWAKKAAAKGTAKEEKDYMLIPAAFLMSGACFDMDQATYTNVKAFWDGEGIPVIAFRMFWDNSKMNIFRDTVLELSKEIQKAYPWKFPDILNETQKLYEDWKNRTWKEKDRLQRAENYWNTYGGILTRALNMSLESDIWGENNSSITDTIIRRKRKENPVFEKYYNLVRAAVWEGNAFKDEYVDDWVGETWIFWLNPHDIILKHMILSQDGGFRNKSIGPKIWEKFANDINATPQKILVAGEKVDSPINRQAQEQYIAELLEEITWSFYEMFSQRTEYTYGLNRATSNIGEDLNKWGLRFENIIWEVSAKSILDGHHRSKFESIAKNIISWKWGSSTSAEIPDVLRVKSSVQTWVAAKLNDNLPRE
jgi:hypothetical protein